MVGAARLRIVLQARTTSSRLPAKVLLPLGGLPLAVLAAKRLSRGGGDLIVATSTEPEDDLLAQTLENSEIKVLRGPLENVLQRFLMATEDLADGDICVRVTGDNPCPDAGFIAECAALFEASGAPYIAYGNDGQWLPYGLSAELFRVGALRAAAAGEVDAYTREHVTPTIRRDHAPKARPAFPDWHEDLGHLRCTVDTLHDYLAMAALFGTLGDPVGTDYREIVARLADTRPRRRAGLILGTVQLGLPYGVTREAGLMPADEARTILQGAASVGCLALDTARAYGESEARIGAALAAGADLPPVITKLAPLDEVADAAPQAMRAAAGASLAASRAALGQERIETLLLHRASHLEAGDGAIWGALTEARDAGEIGALGVSVQSPDELARALALPDVTCVQLPMNLLDWRWDALVAQIRARPDLRVHVRSVFLQGLLVQPDAARWPKIDGVDGTAILGLLAEMASAFGRESVADLCLAYIRSLSWVEGLVMGVDSAAQLHDLARLFDAPALTHDQASALRAALPVVPETLLNPACWS